jgi:AcrR family transcriptional regulator
MRRVLSEEDLREFRSRVCTAATEMLAEFGYDGFNMRKLAARLGVSAMTTYRYFDSKNDILAALRVRAFDRLAGRLDGLHDPSDSPLTRLAEFCRAYVDFAHDEPILYGLMFDRAEPRMSRSPEFAKAERRMFQAFVEQADLFVGTDMPENPERLARSLWASLHGLAALSAIGAICDPERDGLILDMVCRFAGSGGHRALFGHMPPTGAIERQPRGAACTNGAPKSEWIPLTAAE